MFKNFYSKKLETGDNHDTREIGRLIDVAIEELDKPGCDPKWEEIANEAADHLTELIKAKAKAAGF